MDVMITHIEDVVTLHGIRVDGVAADNFGQALLGDTEGGLISRGKYKWLTLMNLNLRHFRTSDAYDQWTRFLQLLLDSHDVESICVSTCYLPCPIMLQFISFVRNIGTRLRYLSMSCVRVPKENPVGSWFALSGRGTSSIRELHLKNLFLCDYRFNMLCNTFVESSLEKIVLKANNLTAQSAYFISKLIRDNRSLDVIDLSTNDLRNDGVGALLGFLRYVGRWYCMYLDNNGTNDAAIDAVVNFYNHSSTIPTLRHGTKGYSEQGRSRINKAEWSNINLQQSLYAISSKGLLESFDEESGLFFLTYLRENKALWAPVLARYCLKVDFMFALVRKNVDEFCRYGLLGRGCRQRKRNRYYMR